jgi:peptidoglycan/xylan/chitin deacetylase (PgdA/CDA1 family)
MLDVTGRRNGESFHARDRHHRPRAAAGAEAAQMQERPASMRSVVIRTAVLLAAAVVFVVALSSNLPSIGGLDVATGRSPSPGASPSGPADVATPPPSPVPSPTSAPSPDGSLPPLVAPTPEPTKAPPPINGSPPPPDTEPPACPTPPSTFKLAPVLAHGDRNAKVVALTFDDGWDGPNTRRILGILKRYHVNATFFPTGKAVLRAPDVWKDIASAGFPIANHTFTHPFLSDLCYSAQLRELRRQASAVRTAIGIRVQPYMRPPYEAWNRTTRIATTAAGERAVVVWNIDTKDWANGTVASITKRALHGGNGAIVLMHTYVHNTAVALPAIIRGYLARGFRFMTIGEMLGIDGPVPYR